MTDQTRSLTAIMFTDIVGYTSLMEKDEAKAIDARERHREIVGVLVKQFQGTVVDKTGDEILTTFPSALRAVDCSLAIQAALRDDSDLKLRIGIHLGEVLKKEDEVIGDGVNVASRIRPLARAGGICVSESVLHLVRNRPHIHAEPLGPHALKNVDQPVKVFALAAHSSQGRPRSRRRRAITVLAGVAAVLLVAFVIFVQNRVAILSSLALNLPRFFGNPIEQKIGFATTSDGIQIAYATTGKGPPLVSVLGWGTHLERGFTSPIYDREGWIRWASKNNLFVRFDGRGFGLSDRDVEDFSLDARVRDLEAVVDALGLERFALYGTSAGGPTAIAYTVRHSKRVSRLILAGTCAKMSISPDERRQWEGMIPLFQTSWDSILVRTMMGKFLMPDADEVMERIGCEFLRTAGDGPAVAGFFQALLFETDARDQARQVDIPTLVVHGQEDPVVPLSNGRDLASIIPGAQFEIIPGADHYQGSFDSPKTRQLIADFLAPTLVDAE